MMVQYFKRPKNIKGLMKGLRQVCNPNTSPGFRIPARKNKIGCVCAVSTGTASPSSRGLWGGDALLLETLTWNPHPPHKVPEGSEVMINNDSGDDHAAWRAYLTGAQHFMVYSHDIHEIRAYNRLGLMADSELLITLQVIAQPRATRTQR
jgi:hypothetical protein